MLVSYRKACKDDVSIIFNQSKELIEKYENTQEINLDAVLNWMNKKIHQWIDEYVCIVVNEKVAGYYRLHKEDGKVELDDFYILSSFQNQGIGSIVMNKLIKEVEFPIYLYVFNQNKGAVAFYERFGFKKIQEVSDTRFIMERN